MGDIHSDVSNKPTTAVVIKYVLVRLVPVLVYVILDIVFHMIVLICLFFHHKDIIFDTLMIIGSWYVLSRVLLFYYRPCGVYRTIMKGKGCQMRPFRCVTQIQSNFSMISFSMSIGVEST